VSNGKLRGPSIKATPLWGSAKKQLAQLLTDEERAQLSVIASIARIKKGALIYPEGGDAVAVFNIISGVVKTFNVLPDRSEHINTFLFPDDLFGLVEAGQYVNSARAVTNVTAYRMPTPALESRLRRNATLEFHVICKLCHELREAQRHAILLDHHNALARIALFLQLLEQHQIAREQATATIEIPMSRSDIAEYVGMTPESVSRTFRTLAKRGIVGFVNHRTIKILDRDRLEALASQGLAHVGAHRRAAVT
jgi:CRP/FNR family transcriptional regulator